MDLSQFDDDTALFIIQLQLEDVEMMKESLGKGKHREGETPDIQVSVDLLKAELDALQQRINDRVMSRSMACAVELDALVIQEAEEGQEQQDATDHQMALGLTEDANTTDNPNDPPAEPTAQVSQIPSVNRWVPRHLRDNQPDRRPESSKQGASRPPGAQPTSACVACSDTFPVVNLMSAPCSHSYCAACVRELFTSSMADESLFPPRCCGQTIPIDSNIAILGPELAQSCQEKKIEYETTNRTYCHVPSCSTFIPPSQIRVYSAKCPRCSAVTCPFCKAEYHLGNCAPNDDPGLQQVLDLAKEQGWQQCKKCSRVVELGRGCYHMMPSSATSATPTGRHANASSGMKTVF
ncbi:ibr finger domain-containing protein [Plectosphaerella cucumerina]|uniref:Ibr finger domain-containing protein n=1 Tax=Plectosphaerella cucumerina TaxID=40658 RepID=A0A8K0T1X2_9PEZI|nr:ibr finger domain-containing protein [Plectosphaerella cucumerina]